MVCISVVPLPPIVLKFGNSEKHNITPRECKVSQDVLQKNSFEIFYYLQCRPVKHELQDFMIWPDHVFIFIKFYCPCFRTKQQTVLHCIACMRARVCIVRHTLLEHTDLLFA